ncbi:MAG TPA: acyltransferase [Chitinophagaceae bacterium]|nr:acyltransferase [Chitinophagaceae bacterium]
MNPAITHHADRQASRDYYPALDGLRGVAILLVVFLHNFGFMNYFFFGWLGVDLFFVLSGFLITELLLKTVGQPGFLKNFYMRRLLRIFPLFYLVLIICLFILPNIKSLNINAGYYTQNQFWLWTYLQNWLYVFKEPYGDKILLHTWSLAVEEQFYLVWPLLILLIRKPKYLLMIITTILIIVGIARYAIWSYKAEDLAYSSLYTFTRIDGLCIGAMVALLQKINPGFLKKYTIYIVLLMAAINFGFYFINDRSGFTLPYLAFVGYTTFAVLFGILLYEAIRGESKIIQFLLDNRPLKFFGKISYGLYVYHWPVYILLFDFTRNWITNKDIISYKIAEACSGVFVTLIAIIISVLSYHYFEKPFLKLKAKYS